MATGLLNYLPEDPNEKAAARQGLLQFGAAMLGGTGNFGQILGGGLMQGAQGYHGALAQQQQAALRAAQAKQVGLENSKLEREAGASDRFARILGGNTSPTAGLPKIGQPSVPATAGTAAPAQASAPTSLFEQYRAMGDRLSAAGELDEANKYYKVAEGYKPKLKEQQARTINGQRVLANVYDDGRTEQVEGFAPDLEKLNFQNTGGATVGLDAYSGKPVNTIRNTQSPDSVARIAQDERNSRRVDARAARTEASKPPSGYRWTATGDLEAIPGGPGGKTAAATEGERKAATLLMRLQGSEKQLSAALKDSPSADKPGLVAQGLRAFGAEALANSTAVGEERQRIESAQLDILDSALTLGTGAAYTREQLEGYRKSYFPQIGDKPKTIADKQARLKNIIEAAKVAAGRAAPATPAPAAATAYQDAEKERRYQEWKRSQAK